MLDAADAFRSRRYATTGSGSLLSEYAPSSAGHASSKAVRVTHALTGAGALSRSLGSFAAGDVVSVSLWFKAAPGVSAAVGIHDGRPGDPSDSKTFVAAAGNGSWQQVTLSRTLARADTLWIHLYGDMFTSTSASATASTFVDYDDVQVKRNGAALWQEGFESGLAVGADPLSQAAWYACDAGLASLQTTTGAPDQWKRDVVYALGRAIAEIDAEGIHELHGDHLGTPRVITAGSAGMATPVGRKEGQQAFAPFGERVADDAWTSGYPPLTGYTGHLQTDGDPGTPIRDATGTGLIYMRGRYYSPAWHRFLNSDQGVDPNQFNQFAYVGGSPLQGVDPSGMARSGGCWGLFRMHCIDFADGSTTCTRWILVNTFGDCGGGEGINSKTEKTPCEKLSQMGITLKDFNLMKSLQQQAIYNQYSTNNPVQEYGFARFGNTYYNKFPITSSYEFGKSGRKYYYRNQLDSSASPWYAILSGVNFHTHPDNVEPILNGVGQYGYFEVGASEPDMDNAGRMRNSTVNIIGTSDELYTYTSSNPYLWKIAGSGWWNLDCSGVLK